MFPLGRNLDEDGIQSFFLNPDCRGLDEGPVIEVARQVAAVEPELRPNNEYSMFVLSVVRSCPGLMPRSFYQQYMLKIFDCDSWKKAGKAIGSTADNESFLEAQGKVLDAVHKELTDASLPPRLR